MVMPSFWGIVNKVIESTDVILLVLDARLVKETRNREIEDKVKELKKPLIYVVTKCDIADRENIEKYRQRLRNAVFISAKMHSGLKELREAIMINAYRAGIKEDKIRVGVLGYPNVGKSSLINAMKGKKSAPTSALSGYTKAVQKIKTGSKIIMLDTPGVIPYKDEDFMMLAKTGSIDYTKAKDPDLVVIELMDQFPGKIEEFYKVDVNEDHEETLEEIAKKRNIFQKGGIPDIKRMARMVLTDWQRGAIK